MRKLVVFGALSLTTSAGFAEETKGAVAPPPPASAEQPAAASPSGSSTGERAAPEGARDPAGGSVLSLVARGDAALVARDLESACAAYQGAATLDPKGAVPHLRLAECQMAQGKLDDALQSSEVGLRVVEPGSRLQLVALSRQAVIFERRGDLERALGAYKLLLGAIPGSSDAASKTLFERIARERGVRIEARQKELADAAIVKARIDEELAETSAKSSTGSPEVVPSKPLIL